MLRDIYGILTSVHKLPFLVILRVKKTTIVQFFLKRLCRIMVIRKQNGLLLVVRPSEKRCQTFVLKAPCGTGDKNLQNAFLKSLGNKTKIVLLVQRV